MCEGKKMIRRVRDPGSFFVYQDENWMNISRNMKRRRHAHS